MPLIRKTRDAAAGVPLDLEAVLAALTNGTPDERWAAARAASELPASTGALGEALSRESNPRVREAMFTSLARMGTAQSVELILPFLRSQEAHMRTAALDALRAAKSAAWPYLPQLLEDADGDVRLLACELVRGVPGEEATRMLCRMLDAELDPNVCASAVEVLSEVGGAQALPVLARCEERFRATPFLAYSIKIAADRIRIQRS